MKHSGYIFLLIFCISCSLFKKKGAAQASGNSKDSSAGREIYYISEAAYLQGNLEEAKNSFLKFIEISPEPGAGYFRLSDIAVRQKKLTEAFDWNRKALEYEDNYYYHLQHAELLENSKEFENAGDIYYSLSKKNPKHWSLFREAARNFKRANNADKLIQTSRIWENAFGLREEIAENYISGYENKGQKDSILYIQKRLIAKYPERRKYREMLWQYYLHNGEVENALQLYNELLKEDPENATVASVMCDYYGRTLTYGPNHWRAIYSAAGNRKISFSAKEQCILSPFSQKPALPADSLGKLLVILTSMYAGEPKLQQIAGDFYFSRKDFVNAEKYYALMLKSNQNLYGVWISRLNCLDSLNEYSKLYSEADSMLLVFPSMVSPYIYSARATMKLGRFDKSIEISEEGLLYAQDNDQKNSLILIMANNLIYLKQYEKSNSYFEKVFSNSPLNAEAFEGLGDLRYYQNRLEDAVKNWQKAKDLGLSSVRLNNKIKNKKIE